MGTCFEFPPGRYTGPPGDDPVERCRLGGGSPSDAPCPRDDIAGVCVIGEAPYAGSVEVMDHAHHLHDGDNQSRCTIQSDGRWFPAPPRYEIDVPDGWEAWSAPPTIVAGEVDLEAYRSPTGLGPTDARVVLLLRRRRLEPNVSAEEALRVDPAVYAAGGVRILGQRRLRVGAAPALQLEGRGALDDGEAVRNLQLFVVDGRVMYVVTCGSAAATYRSWGPACTRALRSFRLDP
jgi:hypothetical protein